MNFNIPNTWELIKPEDYQKYAVLDMGFVVCEGAYLKNIDDENVVITYYNYGIAEEGAFDAIEELHIANERENRLVDGDLEDPNYEDTSLFTSVFYEKITINGLDCFVSVAKYLLPEGMHAYVFQMYFINSDGELLSAQFKFVNFDESNIEKSLNEDATFAEVIASIG